LAHVTLDVPGIDLTNRKIPKTRPLKKSDVDGLCHRDIESLREELDAMSLNTDEVAVKVSPTPALVSFQHEWAEFVGHELKGQVTDIEGAILKMEMSGHCGLTTLIFGTSTFSDSGSGKGRTGPRSAV
jgi:hypothetical protein